MMKITPKQRLKICIVGQLLILISVVIPTVLLANKNSTYYRFGLIRFNLISIKINTWSRYSVLLIYMMIFRI